MATSKLHNMQNSPLNTENSRATYMTRFLLPRYLEYTQSYMVLRVHLELYGVKFSKVKQKCGLVFLRGMGYFCLSTSYLEQSCCSANVERLSDEHMGYNFKWMRILHREIITVECDDFRCREHTGAINFFTSDRTSDLKQILEVRQMFSGGQGAQGVRIFYRETHVQRCENICSSLTSCVLI